jgi:hypothetical protein
MLAHSTYNILMAALVLGLTGCGAAHDGDTDGAGTPEDTSAVLTLGGDEGPAASDVEAAGPSASPVAGENQPMPELPPVEMAPGEDPGPAAASPPARATMTTSGRRLLDSCGDVFVTRGVEQVFGDQLPRGNDWRGLVEQIAATGANAVRILPRTETLSVRDVDALLEVVGEHDMVGYVTPYGSENIGWLGRDEVKAMLGKHEKYIIIDAFGEPTFDDRARFVREATAAIRQVRGWGYRVPLTVTGNQYGRDLPSLLELGDEIIAADPLGNIILGWQAYWGSSGFYEKKYGLSLSQALQAVASAPFPMQLGLDRVTDYPSTETADFATLLAGTESNGVGWLWWDWYNPYGNENNLTTNGLATSLTPTGQTVVKSHAASIARTAKRSCRLASTP